MIEKDLREQILSLSPEEMQEVRTLIDEIERDVRILTLQKIREIRAGIISAERTSREDLRELRDEGWR